jgi:NAD(P)-dependent dehydrogenase (short-subunit alcohol dehydrogenase family)
MRKLILIPLLFLFACATVPESTMQRLIVADWSVTGAANAVADLRPVLAPSDYQNAKAAVLQASAALNCAESAAGVTVNMAGFDPAVCPTLGVPDTPAGYLALVNKLLLTASAYYAAKGE